jgi:YVTN family beta-propeller protein
MKSETVLVRKLAVAGIVSLLLLAGCGGGTSPSSINQPTSSGSNPTITTISPNSTVAGGAAFTLTINGTNFVAASMVNFGGSAPATTFVNSTQLTAAIPAAGIASTGTLAVTVTNPAPGGGTSKAITFTITSGVNSAPTINYLYPSCAPAGSPDSFVGGMLVGGQNFAASSVVRWNGSDQPTTLVSNSGGTQLTAQISASDIAEAGTAAITVFNPAPGGGSSNSLPFTINPGAVDPLSIDVDPAGKFAYVASLGCDGGVGGYVSMYTINSSTGALTSIGPPLQTFGYGVFTESVAVDPSSKFVYVANSGNIFNYDSEADGSVAIYTINATTGALTFTTTTNGDCTGSELCAPSSVAVDPSGKFAYTADAGGSTGDNGVSMFSLNATTGNLTSIGGTTLVGLPNSVAVDPSGKFAYVANMNDTPSTAGDVVMYTINATTGSLTSIGTITAGITPWFVTVDPAGKFAYVANASSNDVSMFTINATTGALTPIGTVATGTAPESVAVDPAGNFAYVTNYGSNDVSMYSINATTGTLTPTGTIATGPNPTSIAIHPSGKFAYVTNSGSNSVSMYSIDSATGTLTLIGTIGT